MSTKTDRRQQILQAAFEAFAESGYDKTTMDDIVKRSGLSKGTLYWHFKNKHDLLLATIEMAMGDMYENMRIILAQEGPASQRLHLAYVEAMEQFFQNPNLIGLIANFFFQSSQSPEAQQIMSEAYDVFIDLTGQLIQQGIDSGEFRDVDTYTTAIMLAGAADGIAFQTLLSPKWDVMQVMNIFFELIISGLKKEHTDQ
jgi:AcrR family transcriptional regulator